jgi:ABC-2 type transport system ATP-binding protein
MPGEYAVEISNLKKSFGDFQAVKGISLEIKKGEIFGILGPNGAGKTTTLNMLLGILTPTSGKITVEGLDINRDSLRIKQMIGFMTQETVVENALTARDNLRLFARLYHMPKERVEQRVEESLEEAALTNFGDTAAGTFSGGMQRRLSLVRSMIQEPKILILDEPTTGLDVQSRVSMWDHITSLHEKGITVILTTQYLEEADALCDRIAIIDHGEIKALGTASELKRLASEGNILEITVKDSEVERISKMIKSKFGIDTEVDGDKIKADIQKKPLSISIKIAQMLEKEGSDVLAFSMHLPTLDDVFIKLTGNDFRDTASGQNVDQRAKMWRSR